MVQIPDQRTVAGNSQNITHMRNSYTSLHTDLGISQHHHQAAYGINLDAALHIVTGLINEMFIVNTSNKAPMVVTF